ncbi:MAG: multidrug effflux MFS transporter [Pseudomonadota bacterium]
MTNSAEKRLSMPLLVAATATGPMALNIFVPSMPAVADEFGAPYSQIQISLSLFFMGLALGQVVYGPLSDRFGRRPILILGLSLFAVSSLLCMLAQTAEMLIIGRAAQGFAGCAGMVLSRAIIGDVAGRERSASLIAYVTMAMVVVPMVSPATGGLIADRFGWQAIFALVFLYAVIVLLWVIFGLRETKHDLQSVGFGGLMANYARLAASSDFRHYAAVGAFGTAGFFAFLGGAPFVVIEVMNQSPTDFGFFFIFPAFCYIGGNFVSARLAPRLGIDRLILIGAIVTAVGAALMLLGGLAGMLTPWAIFLPMLACAFGNGLTIANSAAGAISAIPQIGGSASGLAGFSQMALGALTSKLAGDLVQASQVPVAAIMVVVAVAAVAFAVVRVRGVGTPRPAEA